jgi:phosphoribosylamine--glycine ligase
MAKVLVIGSGGREHSLCKKFSESILVEEVFVAPGNPGMVDCATLVDIDQMDFENLVRFVKENNINLTFVGPEIPLCAGIVDIFEKENLRIFGPRESAAKLEGSKVYSKALMKKFNIPTAKYEAFDNYNLAKKYLSQQKMPIVIKADGLAGGKGVIIAESVDDANDSLKEIMLDNKFKEAGNSVVIEEFLSGEEFSLLSFVNNRKVYPMQIAQDHKKAFDNDLGLNTGGMGAYTPVNHLPQCSIDEAIEKIVKPMAEGMANDNNPFTGILYAGCMLCEDGVKTIEYNVRFGDPEAEVILLALENDLYSVIMDVLDNKDVELKFSDKAYIGLVMASKGYPESYINGSEIEGLDNVEATVFHMGTAIMDNKLVTNGGRVLFVATSGNDLKSASIKLYNEVLKVKCSNLFYRTDIGKQGIK